MTKIPTVREQYEEKFGWSGSSGTFTGIRDEEIVKFIIAEREAGAREERERVMGEIGKKIWIMNGNPTHQEVNIFEAHNREIQDLKSIISK